MIKKSYCLSMCTHPYPHANTTAYLTRRIHPSVVLLPVSCSNICLTLSVESSSSPNQFPELFRWRIGGGSREKISKKKKKERKMTKVHLNNKELREREEDVGGREISKWFEGRGTRMIVKWEVWLKRAAMDCCILVLLQISKIQIENRIPF